MISDDPADIPETTPRLYTVAIAGFEDAQGAIVLAVPDPNNVFIEPIHVVKVPETTGVGSTVTGIIKSRPIHPEEVGVTVKFIC